MCACASARSRTCYRDFVPDCRAVTLLVLYRTIAPRRINPDEVVENRERSGRRAFASALVPHGAPFSNRSPYQSSAAARSDGAQQRQARCPADCASRPSQAACRCRPQCTTDAKADAARTILLPNNGPVAGRPARARLGRYRPLFVAAHLLCLVGPRRHGRRLASGFHCTFRAHEAPDHAALHSRPRGFPCASRRKFARHRRRRAASRPRCVGRGWYLSGRRGAEGS